jgi:hypothetical protein
MARGRERTREGERASARRGQGGKRRGGRLGSRAAFRPRRRSRRHRRRRRRSYATRRRRLQQERRSERVPEAAGRGEEGRQEQRRCSPLRRLAASSGNYCVVDVAVPLLPLPSPCSCTAPTTAYRIENVVRTLCCRGWPWATSSLLFFITNPFFFLLLNVDVATVVAVRPPIPIRPPCAFDPSPFGLQTLREGADENEGCLEIWDFGPGTASFPPSPQPHLAPSRLRSVPSPYTSSENAHPDQQYHCRRRALPILPLLDNTTNFKIFRPNLTFRAPQ